MARNSRIEWTHHTFNPWWGCTKISPACDNCYAEAWAKRTGHSIWGAKADRRFLSEGYWREPLKWDATAKELGVRFRVFCASMADVFEWNSELSPVRARLWRLIEDTPHLDWLLLTKRPHLANRLTPWARNWPRHVWLGTTVENQKFAEKRVVSLLNVPARVRFLSCEPLLELIDLERWLGTNTIHWVIAGGESGPKARQSDPDWFRALRDQCQKHNVAFHFKQWGDWFPIDQTRKNYDKTATTITSTIGAQFMRLGKKASGRLLDGRTWDDVPNVRAR